MTNEVIIFPDVEGLAITYLKGVITDAHISTKVPDDRPTRMIQVSTVGGTKRRINADGSMITFKCWEADSVQASLLARTARAYMHALAGQAVDGTWVYKVIDVGAPAFNPDPQTGTPRYQFTVMVDVKGVTLSD